MGNVYIMIVDDFQAFYFDPVEARAKKTKSPKPIHLWLQLVILLQCVKKMKSPTTVRKQPRQPCRGLDKSAPSKPTLETLQRRSSWSDKNLYDCHTNQIWKKKTKEGAGKTDWKQSQSKKGNSKVIEELWLDSMVQWVHSF